MADSPSKAACPCPHTRALRDVDSEIADLIAAEERYECDTIRLIPSENYVSMAVLAATGSIFANKYSEGYASKRYYEGQVYVDQVEKLAIARACALFGVEHANVQPYSGSPANMAACFAVLRPGDTVMGLGLPFGGHLTHGWNVNFSGMLYRAVQYELDPETHRIDLDRVRDAARRERPKAIFCGGTAYPRLWDFAAFRAIADEVGAVLIADIAHVAGLVAAGAHPSPVPHAQIVTTTTHKTLRGPRGGLILTNDEEIAKKIDRALFPGLQGGPLMHIVGAKAIAFGEALQPSFKTYAKNIVANAKALASALQERGFRVTTGGTENHLMLVDLRPFDADLTGADAEKILERAGIITNKNGLPGDTRPPRVTSGLRLGTPALTTRGFGPEEMRRVAELISRVLKHRADEQAIRQVREEVRVLCAAFPLPGHIAHASV